MLDEKIRGARFVVTISEVNRRCSRAGTARRGGKTVVIHCGADPAVFQPRGGPGTPPARPRFRLRSAADGRDLDRGQPPAAEGPPVPRRGLRPAPRSRLVGPLLVRRRGRGAGRPRGPDPRPRPRDVVTLEGALPRDRVAGLIARTDVVVQPSVVLASGKTEGIPVALMEALAAERRRRRLGRQRHPGARDRRSDGAPRPAGDPVAIADAIERLAADPDLRAPPRPGGPDRVLAEFDLHVTTAELAARFAASVAEGPVGA